MSAFSVSDLLNPAPLSHPGSPMHHDIIMTDDPPTTLTGDMFAPELFHTDSMMDGTSIFDQQGMISLPHEHSSSPEFMRKDSVATADLLNGMDHGPAVEDDLSEERKKERSTKQRDPEKLKDTKHSSKNEGQHTDRRYLCYICHKLFTRRRSVRDHLVKIHAEKAWDPSKSLEVVVEPHTGEPIEPIEEIVARGPPRPPPRPPKSSKSSSSKEEKSSEAREGTEQPQPQQQEDQVPDLQELDTREESPEVPLVRLDEREQAEQNQESEAHQPSIETDPVPGSQTKRESEPAPIPKPVTVPMKLKKEDSQRSESRPASIERTAATPGPIIGKKRPLPMAKKGTAKSVKSSTPSSKRLKLTDSERSTPARSPSVTPATKAGSKLKKPLTIASPASRASSRQASPSPTPSGATIASSNEDGQIFCICRKGDNHTWMIACDGPCEEWYHGKCIGIQQKDGDLIDKFICPLCEKDGYITTWKRMCRRADCRKPARVKDDPPSKYCSLECGRMFFVDLVRRGDSSVEESKDGQFIVEAPREKKTRKKVRKERHAHAPARPSGTATPIMSGSRPHTPAYSDDERSEYETNDSADEDQLPNRGGALRAGEVKALLSQCRTIDSWRELGKKPETPPRELDEKERVKLVYDDYEITRIAAIKRELADLDQKLEDLAAREKMLELIKARSTAIADDIKKSNPKLKNVCGYDARVAWCDEEFLAWLNSGGKQTLDSGKVGPPEHIDTHMNNGVDASDDEGKAATMKGGVCIRNNCPKHGRTWQKSQLAELRFEQDLVRKRQHGLAGREHEIRSRAQIRALELKGPVVP